MNDIKKRFEKFREEHPSLGDVIILSMTIDSQGYKKDLIQRAFNLLVSKEEYDLSEKRDIINSLIVFSNDRGK